MISTSPLLSTLNCSPSHQSFDTNIMASFSSDYKLSDVQLCEGNACNRWWLKALFSVPGSRSSQRCPHCRGAPTEPTKYWHGGRSGPKAPSYDYPGYLSPQSIKRPDQSSAKRSTPIDTTMATPSANKKHKLQQVSSKPFAACEHSN